MAQGLWRPLLQSPPPHSRPRMVPEIIITCLWKQKSVIHTMTLDLGAHALTSVQEIYVQHWKRPTIFGSRLIFCSAPLISLTFISSLCLINWLRNMLWYGGGVLGAKENDTRKSVGIFLYVPSAFPVNTVALWGFSLRLGQQKNTWVLKGPTGQIRSARY